MTIYFFISEICIWQKKEKVNTSIIIVVLNTTRELLQPLEALPTGPWQVLLRVPSPHCRLPCFKGGEY